MDTKVLKRGERELIAGCALFKDTEDRFVVRVLSDERCRLVELQKGEIVFEVYDYRRCLGLILSGSVAVTKPNGGRYAMNTLGRGSLFGSANLYDADTEVVSVLTAGLPCRIVFFPCALLETLMREENAVALNYIRFLTSRVRFLNDKIQGLVSESAEAALKQYIVANAVTIDGRLLVQPAGSISALAETLNIGRASLYRAFEALELAGLIRKNGREIHILNLEGLLYMDAAASAG